MVKFNFKNVSILSLIFFILLFLRRKEQLINPQIWNEDGPFNMASYILKGWGDLLVPTSGYLIVIPKLITNISMEISFIYYPEISTYLTWAFTIILALIVVYAPTALRYRVVAAISIFLIPTNAEAFGLPLYLLWFSAIFLFLVALWKPHQRQIFKNILLIFGGFSSPVIVVLIPVQIFRAFVFKYKKEEIITLILTIVISVIQLSFVIHHQDTRNLFIDSLYIQNLIHKFFAFYYLNGFNFDIGVIGLWLGSIYIIAIILIYFFTHLKDYFFMILVYLLMASIALSCVRMGPIIIFPFFGGGARYFFLPYILLSWTLIYIMAENKWYEILIIPVLTLSVVVALQVFCRTHEDLNWRKEIDKCQKAKGKYPIPIENDGNAKSAWHMVLPADICKEYIQKDFFKLPNKDKR